MSEQTMMPMDYDEFIYNKYTKKSNKKNQATDEQMKIVDLIDDCLEPIFMNLTQEDLGSIAEANLRFLEKACYAYAKKFGETPFESGYDECDSNTFERSMNIIKHFGKFITKLDLYDAHNDCYYNEMITDALFENCHRNVTDICFDRVDEHTLNKICQPFPNLNNLYIYDLSLPQKIAQLNRWFPNVTKLILRCTGPFLEEYCRLRCLIDADINMNIENMKLFLRSNPQLRSLRLRCNNSLLIDGELLNFMANNLPNLENLMITINNWNPISYMANAHFNKLRTLTLSLCWDMNNVPNDNPTSLGITSNVLEQTKIKGLYLNNACIEFAMQCHNATELEFTVDDDIDTFLLIRLARNCRKLKKLQFIFVENGNDYDVDADGFVHLLANCPELTHITLNCVFRFIINYTGFCRTFIQAKLMNTIDSSWKQTQIIGQFQTIDIEFSK